MYITTKNYIKQSHALYPYCMKTCAAAKSLYNAALFRIRNRFTGRSKDSLSPNEQEVLEELHALERSGKWTGRVGSVFSYGALEKLMRITGNPDFFNSGISMQTSQGIVKSAVSDFKNWLASCKAYQACPASFLGIPRMPKYVKSQMKSVTLSNQDCTCKEETVKFPLTGKTLRIRIPSENARLMEVKIKPYYNGFLILCTFQTEDVPSDSRMPFLAGIDFGVENAAAIVTDEGHALLFKGGAMKSRNQSFNKERARLASVITKGHAGIRHPVSQRIDSCSMHRDMFLRDQMHKISAGIVKFCVDNRIGTVILGVNRKWKQNVRLGRQNNQNFVSMPLSVLRFMITYKLERAGILVAEQEESYTSKADFLSGDEIPVYGVDDRNAAFSGKRSHRGLYESGTGIVLNADINGAANILRKARKDAFAGVSDFTYLQNPDVYGFHKLNPSGIPVKGIAAA